MLLRIQRIMYYINIPQHSPLSFLICVTHKSKGCLTALCFSLVEISKFSEHTLIVQSAMQITPINKTEAVICLVVGEEGNVFLS